MSKHYLGKFLSKMFGLPQIGTRVTPSVIELKVETNKENGSEYWNRIFYDATNDNKQYEFNTIQRIEGENLVEYYKLFKFEMENTIHSNNKGFTSSLINTSINLNVFANSGKRKVFVQIPKIFQPSVIGNTICTDKGWLFDVKIEGPKWADGFIGLIYQYKGEITKSSALKSQQHNI